MAALRGIQKRKRLGAEQYKNSEPLWKDELSIVSQHNVREQPTGEFRWINSGKLPDISSFCLWKEGIWWNPRRCILSTQSRDVVVSKPRLVEFICSLRSRLYGLLVHSRCSLSTIVKGQISHVVMTVSNGIVVGDECFVVLMAVRIRWTRCWLHGIQSLDLVSGGIHRCVSVVLNVLVTC